jgi:hypothetical protein
MPFNLFSRSNDSKNIKETSFQDIVTDLSLKRKKSVNCPTDEKYRASIDYEFNTREECERAKREIAEELAERNKPYVRRDLAKEDRDRRQMIRDSEDAFFKAERRRSALGNFDVIYPNEKVGAVVTIQGKPYTLDNTLRPIVEGGRKSRKIKSRKTKTKTKRSKKRKSKKNRK